MIQSIIKRAKERFESKLENWDGLNLHSIQTRQLIKDFLETEIRAVVEEVLEEVSDVTFDDDNDHKYLQKKINEILDEKE